MAIDPVFSSLICIAFALLFGLGAAHKIRNRQETQQTIERYEVLPRRLAAAASLIVPFAEGLIALGLLCGTTREIAAGGGAALLLVYAFAMSVNLYRGRRDLDCGCSFGRSGQTISEYLVVRNALLSGMLLMAVLPVSTRDLGAVDAFAIVAGLLSASLLYATANTLIENQNKRI